LIGVVYHLEDPKDPCTDGAAIILSRLTAECKQLKATYLIVVDMTRFKVGRYWENPEPRITFSLHDSIDEVEKGLHGAIPMVYLGSKTIMDAYGLFGKSLKSFEHPDECIYVSMPESCSIVPGRGTKTWVCMPVEGLSAETSLKIVLFDRLVKK
jgi:hypothetical protein